MTLTLRHLAIHELIKTPENTEAALRLSDRLLPIDDRAVTLIGRLDHACARKNDLLNGRLAAPEDALFSGYYELLREAKYEAEAFLRFSQDSMQALQLSLQGVVGAKGGYLVYALYATEAERQEEWLGIFLVRDAEGLLFQLGAEGGFELRPTTYVDVDRMALAGRIAVQPSTDGASPRIEVLKHARTQKEISDYFLHWLGIEESVSNRELTRQFLDAVASVPKPLDAETGEPLSEGVFRERVANFAMKSPGSVLSIPAFEEAFYGQEQPIQAYLSEQSLDNREAFRFDRQAVREYHFHKFKSQGLYFGCQHAHLLSGLVRVEDGRVVIDDSDLADQLNELIS